jgi:hypothetical protein
MRLSLLRGAALALGLAVFANPALAEPPDTHSLPNLAAPASIGASLSWVSRCLPAASTRAFTAFAAMQGAATLSVQRYADASCTQPAGGAVPSAPLVLTTGSGCPSSSYCGSDASNDGLPFLTLKMTITDTSAAANNVIAASLVLGAE